MLYEVITNRLHEVTLLDLRGYPGAGSTPLYVDHDERYLRHGRPTEGFHLERHARTLV